MKIFKKILTLVFIISIFCSCSTIPPKTEEENVSEKPAVGETLETIETKYEYEKPQSQSVLIPITLSNSYQKLEFIAM